MYRLCNTQTVCVRFVNVCLFRLTDAPSLQGPVIKPLCTQTPNPWPTSIYYTKFTADSPSHTHTHTDDYKQLSHTASDATILFVLHDVASDVFKIAFAFIFFHSRCEWHRSLTVLFLLADTDTKSLRWCLD